MSTAIVLATHGIAAEQIFRTAEMLIGVQSNVETVTFESGENAETLKAKYQQIINDKLSHATTILFLVDMFGGSPYNAAVSLAADNENYEVVAGVNIPMLTNVCMSLEDGMSLQELTALAIEAGQEGIKAYKTTIAPQPAVAKPKKQAPVITDGKYMDIRLARIDDRLIHGQVAGIWTKETQVDRIIVVSDEVVADNVRATMLKQVAPPGVTAHVVGLDKMVRVYNNPEYSNDKVLLLFNSPADALSLIEKGVPLTNINIGGISYKEGKTQITSAVCVNQADIDAFKKLDEKKVILDVRKVPSDSRANMMDLLKNNNLL